MINPTTQKIIYLSICFMLLYGSKVNGQSSQIKNDSLQIALIRATTDSARLDILIKLGNTNDYSNRELSNQYYRQALNLDISKTKRAQILNFIGYNHWQLGNFEEAISYYQKALHHFIALKDSTYLGILYNNIAVSHWGMGQDIEALENYQNSLRIRSSVRDTNGVSKVLNNIGKLYQELKLYDDAFTMHKRALRLAQQQNHISNIAYSYSTIGDCYIYYEELDSALYYYQHGLQILRDHYKEYRLNSYFAERIGKVYFEKNILDSALYYSRLSIKYAIDISNQNSIAMGEYYLGKTFLELNQPDSARYYLNRSYDKATDKGYAVLMKDILFTYARIEEKNGTIAKAYEYHKKATALNDSIFNKDVVTKIAELQLKFLTARQQQENLILRKNNEIQQVVIKQQRSLTYAVLAIVFFILVALFFLNKNRKRVKRLNLQLEKSKQKLQLANSEKDKFFTILAHDLKSPLNGIVGVASFLSTDFDKLPPDKTKELIVVLKKTSDNLYELLEGLLQWSKIQIGSADYNFGKLNLYELSTRIIHQLDTPAKEKQISLINSLNTDAVVYADKESVNVILRNLVTNAIKFTPQNGEVRLDCKKNGSKLAISVTDNGVGIPKKQLEKLFLLGEKISTPGTNNEKGTGLGLILCKELIEKNNGKIGVESEEGKGSRFYFNLPTDFS